MAFSVNKAGINKQSHLVTMLPRGARLDSINNNLTQLFLVVRSLVRRDEKIAIEFNGNEHSHTTQ